MKLTDFYKSDAWRSFRAFYISKMLEEQGEIICARCGKPILKSYDVILHHKIELNASNFEDASIALNPDNVEPLHLRCHNEEHGKGWLWTGERHVYLIYGPPSAGKTTYVRNTAHAKDLIVDVDEIYNAITTARSEALLGTVLAVRNMLIDTIERRQGKWQDAFVIGGFPQMAERERLIDRLGAIPVFIMEPKEVLYEREKARGRNRKDIIDDWFRVYERTSPPGVTPISP